MTNDSLPGEGLLRHDFQSKFLFFDFETCHLNLLPGANNLIWNIGAITTDRFKILSEHEWFPYYEDLEISKDAARITKFDPWAYKQKGRDPKICYQEFYSLFENPNYILVGHNVLGFDLFLLRAWELHLGKKKNLTDWNILYRVIDTNCMGKAMRLGINLPEFGTDDFILAQLKLCSHRNERKQSTNLTALGKYFEIEYDYENLHDAKKDIGLNFLVFQKLISVLSI